VNVIAGLVLLSTAAHADPSTTTSTTATTTTTAPDEVKWTDREPVLGDAQRVDGDEGGDVIAFTFDDGPNETTTPVVLEALKTYGIPATFFVVTKRLRGKVGRPRRELVLRELAEGHLVGSHTVSHPNLRSLGKAAVVKEIDQSLKTLTGITKAPIGMFRPPFGALGGTGAAQLAKRNLTDVRWELDSYDFRTPNPRKLRKRVAKMIEAGGRGVILFHDTKQSTSKAIVDILDDLEAMNCARLDAGQEPVLPVTLHYFLRDHGKQRPVPPEVAAKTQAYRDGLPARCSARQQKSVDTPDPTPR
jgi:peptidoglycan/xylan/chitin deacetylase (PgdA/CDA1 family)